MNILITSCGRDISLIKAFRSALINNGGGKVIASDISYNAPGLYFADEYVLSPSSDDPSFIPFILDICIKNDIKLLITARDAELITFAEAKSKFDAINVKILTAPLDSLRICRNKLLFCKFCEENGFPIPKTYFHEDQINYPAFIKPITGAGSLNVHKLFSKKELELVKEIYSDIFLIQELVDWPEYSIDLFSDFHGRVISVIPRERIRTVGGESYVGRTYKNEILINESIKIAQALKLIGPNTIQCFFSGSSIKFIEVNPRFGGGANLGFNSGANVPELLVRILNGESIEPCIGEFKDKLLMLRYTCDIFLEESFDDDGNKIPQLIDSRTRIPNQIYCIDVDGTICTERVAYENVIPIKKTVSKINELFDAGHKIILYTARGANSGFDWTELTETQLKAWGVKYHEFRIGKPFADWYVDNKALHILDWI